MHDGMNAGPEGASPTQGPDRRTLLLGAAALPACLAPRTAGAPVLVRRNAGPVLVGSANALPGMQDAWNALAAGAHPLDAALDVVSIVEANPKDTSVGLGGLPNERGVVQLDAACMDGATHNSGAVAAIENILHPARVARLVMERTDHVLIVGKGAYEFARMHGHPHTELLTENARKIWLRWKETMSDVDDRFPAPETSDDGASLGPAFSEDKDGALLALDATREGYPWHGTVHCSALSRDGQVACTTTTSGLAFKVPGRVGDSPIVGSGLFCDAEGGSAGATGRGEAAVLSNGSSSIVDLLRRGASPEDAGMEVLERITRQVTRQSSWQPGLVDDAGRPSFGLNFYIVGLDGRTAGVQLRGGGGGKYAVADGDGARHEKLTVLHRV